MQPISITGLGIVNSLGVGVEQTWQKMLNNETGIRPISWTGKEDQDYYFKEYLSKCPVPLGAPLLELPDCPIPEFAKDWRHLDPSIRIALHATWQAVEDAELRSKRVAVIFGSIGSSHTRSEGNNAMYRGKTKFPPRKTLNFELGHMSAIISRVFGFEGPSLMVHNACSTGLTAIDYAQRMLETDPELDAVVVGGGDLPLEATSAFYFSNLQALTSTDCRPFDNQRSGFVLGEGSGAMVLERECWHKTPYSSVLAVGAVTVGEHETSPDHAGKAATQAVLKAVKSANASLDDIGYINAHATGTEVGDIIEYNAMKSILPGRVMTANKGQIGHTICSSGIIETAYTALALRDQVTPPIHGLSNPVGWNMTLPTELHYPISTQLAIKNNYAFGGRSMSVLLSKSA
jgi:3-oxoacyl-[acyl-carrier-protein] synthase II